ncbi:lipopolysaccharide biosynthesis protein [Corticimicrobacter populi]|uniref:Translocase n=1 Tax=Corticimicrobacter populi TaxID=2175229 RepID=A0A2V1K0K7_9BURK|nr:lipopolysaccharide biosynthesis protein [Corticimicrobacter populi]PWF22169.1 hypothetical protein DD235_12365 [Corticimicrobacter populi]
MSSYWRSVTSVFMGTLMAQMIPIVGSLVIARQYLPDEFGAFSVWLGVVTFLSVVLTARFETALALEDDGNPRQQAVLAALIVTLMLTMASALIVGAIAFLMPAWLGEFSLLSVLLLVPAALALSVSQIWQSWAAAEGSYAFLSIMRIVQAAGITLLQISAGMFLATSDALVGAYAIGVMLGGLISAKLMPFKVSLKWQHLWPASKKFWVRQKKFPMFSLPADAISAASAQLPVVIVAARFGTETAGLLAMTFRILGAPIGLLGKAVLDVFKRHAAESFRKRGECRDEYIRTFTVLAIGSLLFCSVMAIFSESAFAFAFGESWRGAGTIAVWLLPLFALRFMASPLSYMVYIAGKQHVDLFWQIVLLAMTYLSLSILHGYEQALQVYSAGYSLLYVIYLAMSYRFSLGERR